MEREGVGGREREREGEEEGEEERDYCLRLGVRGLGRPGPGRGTGHWRAHAGLAGFCAALAASLDARGPPRRC